MTAIRRERIPLLWSTVRKKALAKGFNLTGDGPGAGGSRGGGGGHYSYVSRWTSPAELSTARHLIGCKTERNGARVRACVRSYVRACMRVCVCVCLCACVRACVYARTDLVCEEYVSMLLFFKVLCMHLSG